MNVFEIIFPILLTGLIGWLLVKSKIIQGQEGGGLSKVTFLIFIPALLFKGTYTAKDIGELNIGYALAFYIPVVGLFFLSRYFFNKVMRQTKIDASFAGLGASYSNVVLVGIPVLLNAIGDEAIVPIFFIISIHSAILFTLTSYFTAPRKNEATGLKNIFQAFYIAFKNPLVLSLMLGMVFNYFGIALPNAIESVMVLLSQAALPSALIVLGAALASYHWGSNLKLSLLICLLKLVVLPSLVWGLSFHIFHLSSMLATVLIILAATPVGINVYALAVNHQKMAPVIASSVLLSTVISIVSIPLWLYLIQ